MSDKLKSIGGPIGGFYFEASVGWALVAHAFHATRRQPETRSGCLCRKSGADAWATSAYPTLIWKSSVQIKATKNL